MRVISVELEGLLGVVGREKVKGWSVYFCFFKVNNLYIYIYVCVCLERYGMEGYRVGCW